jgi:hypothetical protein
MARYVAGMIGGSAWFLWNLPYIDSFNFMCLMCAVICGWGVLKTLKKGRR